MILNRITHLVPDLEHATPDWSTRYNGLILTTIGRAHLQWRPIPNSNNQRRATPVINKPRFGLCVPKKDGQIYLWTDSEFGHEASVENPPYASSNPNNWSPLSDDTETKSIYKYPIVLQPQDVIPGCLADGTTLWAFLQDVFSDIRPPYFSMYQAFDIIQRNLGFPEEVRVIVPRLIDSAESPQGHEREQPPENRGISELEKSSKLPKTQVSKNNSVDSNHRNDVPTFDKATDEVLKSLKIEKDQGAFITSAPNISGRYYVYALRDPNTSTPFYIGKGSYDRAMQHFKVLSTTNGGDPYGAGLKDESPIGLEPDSKVGASPEDILTAEDPRVSSQCVLGEPIDDDDEPDETPKRKKIRELLNGGISQGEITRVIARGLSCEAALGIESMLIKSVYGLDNLTNKSRGHHDERFRALNDWDYKDGFDLPVDQEGKLLPDYEEHPFGAYYVYVLFDPQTKKPFYVGKGKTDRLCQHFKDAIGMEDSYKFPRLVELKGLLDKGIKPSEIGRIIARVDDEALAFVIESFYMKFVVGFRQLRNIQPGHLYGMFRSKDDWEARYGFDLPIGIEGGMRSMLRDMFMGDGLDDELTRVVYSPQLANLLENPEGPKLVGAGELAFRCKMRDFPNDVVLQVHIRCARRIQVCLIPVGNDGREWIETTFSRFGFSTLLRRDLIFIPRAWRGALNLAVDTDEAIRRAKKLIEFASRLHGSKDTDDLRKEFQELLDDTPSKKL